VRSGVVFTVALPFDYDCGARDLSGKGQHPVNTPNFSPFTTKSNRLTQMQRSAKTVLLVTCLSPLLTWNQANAADPFVPKPFVPDKTPFCSSEIRSGANAALDKYMDNVEKSEMDKYSFRERWLDTITGEYPYKQVLRDKAQVKIKELEAFARKKYKCRLDLFYVAP
jgi:hypothetical protein